MYAGGGHTLLANLESKAFYQSILYFLRESITNHNNNLTYIILTNTYEFYLIDAKAYFNFTNDNKALQRAFENCEHNKGNDTSTSKFYEECKRILPKIETSIEFTYFNLKNLKDLSLCYLALSPQILLKQKIYRDANTLNQGFYNELLYILGLQERKEKGKITITLSDDENTLSDALIKAHSLDKAKDFEDIFALITTWNNRLLFLRLLESMLIDFKHIEKPFLDIDIISNFTTLSTLFFEILATNYPDRNATNTVLDSIPYLNSSLFDKSELESQGKEIKNLESRPVKIYKDSILYNDKDIFDKLSLKGKDSLPLLTYLFAFLETYDFRTTAKDIKDHINTSVDKLINSAVLGLVFEKLNGYKEGSFYTYSFITSYMCRQSLQKVVIDKFNEANPSWRVSELKHIRTEIRDELREDRENEAKIKAKHKALLQSITICDPAVGSGHFLVSALNEMLFIYSELNLFENDFFINLRNDEILIFDGAKEIHYKNPHLFKDNEALKAHRIQQELFELKKSVIENNLFGVDINPNSCEITKLRLWIELLKSSYYADLETPSKEHYHDLATLPNVDINIKCGNSLVSNISLDITKDSLLKDLKKMASQNANIEFAEEFAALANDLQNKLPSKIDTYKAAVNAYKNETDRDLKEKHKKDIKDSKDFIIELFFKTSPEFKNLKSLLSGYLKKYGYDGIDNANMQIPNNVLESIKKSLNDYLISFNFHKTLEIPKEPKAFSQKDFEELVNALIKYETLRDTPAFEWRFKFPEVLDSNGYFKGFDLIIGNPPYIRQEEIKELKPQLQKAFSIYKGTSDIYTYFYELGFRLLRNEGIVSLITSNKWCRAAYGEPLREFLLQNTSLLEYVDCNGIKVFESATVDTSILSFEKAKKKDNFFKYLAPSQIKERKELEFGTNFRTLKQRDLNKEAFIFTDEVFSKLKAKIEKIGTPLKDWDINIYRGVLTGYNEAFIIDSVKREEILASCKDEAERAKTSELIKPILRGRDIKRYAYEWAGLWLINTHNGYTIEGSTRHCEALQKPKQSTRKSNDDLQHHEANASCNDKIKIPPINIEEYPTLKAYFDKVASEGKQGKGKGFYNRDDKGVTPYNLRNCAYLEEFAKPKIVYSEIVREPQFYLDNGEFKFGHFYVEATAFVLSGNENFKNSLEYLLGILHSKLATFAFKNFYAGGGLGESGYRYKKAFLEKLPIPKISQKQESEFIALVKQIIESKNSTCHFERSEKSHTNNKDISGKSPQYDKRDISPFSKAQYDKDTQDLESKLDSMVYALYGLNDEEIKLMGGG